MKVISLIFTLIILIFLIGCNSPINCTDPIGCLTFNDDQVIQLVLIQNSDNFTCVEPEEVFLALRVGKTIMEDKIPVPIEIITIDVSTSLSPFYEISPVISDFRTLAVIDATCEAGLDLEQSISNAGLVGLSFQSSVSTRPWPGISRINPKDLPNYSSQSLSESDKFYQNHLHNLTRSKLDSPLAMVTIRWISNLIDSISETMLGAPSDTIKIPLDGLRQQLESINK